ncbi:GNAT family N-acetyltransferase [Stomatobaculum longum]|uniref:GNAT family N-acetyltransferase n=1 Tax=Stomatobaculum longum TaxID=796942 RepID=UPI0028F10156|nr:GNAT family N-acetyltransferase [Stomatobaculum longum]
MKLTEQDRLNHGEQDKIMDLLKRCHEKEAFSMTFPILEPGTKYLLAYDSKDPKELRAVMALCGLGDQIFEVYAFTDPDYRKQGYFRRLWEKAKITFPGKSLKGAAPVVRFPIDGSCKDALPVLLSIGAHLAEEETEMECELEDKPTPDSRYRFLESKPSPEGFRAYQVFRPEDKKPAFRCFVTPLKDNKAYLHRIATRKDLIGQGVGSELFPQFLGLLKKLGYKKAVMQVSASNTPAVRLYTENGFRKTTSLRYYELLL